MYVAVYATAHTCSFTLRRKTPQHASKPAPCFDGSRRALLLERPRYCFIVPGTKRQAKKGEQLQQLQYRALFQGTAAAARPSLGHACNNVMHKLKEYPALTGPGQLCSVKGAATKRSLYAAALARKHWFAANPKSVPSINAMQSSSVVYLCTVLASIVYAIGAWLQLPLKKGSSGANGKHNSHIQDKSRTEAGLSGTALPSSTQGVLGLSLTAKKLVKESLTACWVDEQQLCTAKMDEGKQSNGGSCTAGEAAQGRKYLPACQPAKKCNQHWTRLFTCREKHTQVPATAAKCCTRKGQRRRSCCMQVCSGEA